MLKLTQVVSHCTHHSHHPTQLTLTLPYEKRTITRQRVRLDQGIDAGLFLERRTTLKQGDYLKAETGELIQVLAALETVSVVFCEDALLLARICYHLGNRHVPLQISSGQARYLHDHVLDDMVQGLGVQVVVTQATFEPEAGAYSGGHSHSDHHEHTHDH
ncbi:MAG: urease accessory protein UreE [Pseudomonadota bacterium]|jgi:urease accessory protein